MNVGEDRTTTTAQTATDSRFYYRDTGLPPPTPPATLAPDGYIIDGILTPGNAASGNVPSTVTTDANGLAEFNLNYLKQHAYWIATRVTAKLLAQGSESTSSLTFRLAGTTDDVEDCVLPDSPYN